jgi:hypothetical protein
MGCGKFPDPALGDMAEFFVPVITRLAGSAR